MNKKELTEDEKKELAVGIVGGLCGFIVTVVVVVILQSIFW